jgi:hypothetical protein
VPQIVSEIRSLFKDKVRPQLVALFEVVPSGQYYRFYQMFNFTVQRLVFCAAMANYLDTEKVLLREAAAEWLGLAAVAEDHGKPHLDLEDYLGGLIQMSNELVGFLIPAILF